MKIKLIPRILVSLINLNYNYIKCGYERFLFRQSKAKLGHHSYFPNAEDVLKNPYIFVLSTGRCGTGLITDILSKSPRLRVEHNPKPELEYVSSIVHRDNISEEAQKIAILAARFDLFFLDTFLRGKIYVETNNRISFFAPALADLLPNAKFIHLVRDPADFVRSGMRRRYYQDGVVQHQRLDGSNYSPWNTFSRLEKVAWEWNEINKKIENFKAIVDPGRVLMINSEALYKDPAMTFEIFDFIEFDNPFIGRKGLQSLEKLLSTPVNKQKEGYFPKYAQWDESDKNAFQNIVTLAAKYGYIYE